VGVTVTSLPIVIILSLGFFVAVEQAVRAAMFPGVIFALGDTEGVAAARASHGRIRPAFVLDE